MPESTLQNAKLTFDKLYDPATDIDSRLKEIDSIAQAIRTHGGAVGAVAEASSRHAAQVRRYEAGPWNRNRPFQYDLSDPFGRKPANRLLSTYLVTHRGNCVSMPILFVALAQRLGLHATLSTAPGHMFVKYTDDVTGKTFNLETTSGAYPARDVWIRKIMPMTDQAIANGLYMKDVLSGKEALAVMAGIVLEHRIRREKSTREAWDVAEVLRPYYPNNLAIVLAPTDAALGLIREEYLSKYPKRSDIPPALTQRLAFLEGTVSRTLDHAHALGWRETDGEGKPSTLIGKAVPQLELAPLDGRNERLRPARAQLPARPVQLHQRLRLMEKSRCRGKAAVLAALAGRRDVAL